MKQKDEYSFIASLQINNSHMCCACMFQLGFLITAARCAIKIQKEQEEAYAVMGHFELNKGERLQIQGLNTYKSYIGIIKVGKMSMFNPFARKTNSAVCSLATVTSRAQSERAPNYQTLAGRRRRLEDHAPIASGRKFAKLKEADGRLHSVWQISCQ